MLARGEVGHVVACMQRRDRGNGRSPRRRLPLTSVADACLGATFLRQQGWWTISLIAIDVDIADTLQAIDKILTRRESEHATVWKSLGDKLQAVSLTVGELDNMYYRVLAEIDDIFSQSKPDTKRIDDVVKQAQTYCTDTRLTFCLEEWRGEIQGCGLRPRFENTTVIASSLRRCVASMVLWESSSIACRLCNHRTLATCEPIVP
jgi:hypothetical protein